MHMRVSAACITSMEACSALTIAPASTWQAHSATSTTSCLRTTQVNWRSVTRASQEVKEGDVISASGKGRVEVKGVSMTKKDRYAVSMVRYV